MPTTKSAGGVAERRESSDRFELTHRLLSEAMTADAAECRRLQDEAIVMNAWLAESVARRYSARAADKEDIRQVAYLGLVNAVRRFSPAKGVDFASFALPTISGEVKRFFRDYGWTVRPPRRIQELHRNLKDATAQLSQSLERTPTTRELAEHLDEDVADIDEASSCQSCYTPSSIDAPTQSADSTPLSETLAAVEPGFGRSEAKTMLGPVCRELCERDRYILSLRFVRGWTQQDIAGEIGVTQMQVSRLLARILDELHEKLTGPGRSRRSARSGG